MKVAVIGGGAAGFFAAIHAKENFPAAQVTIFEKSKKLLAKVKVSGGGRCNVTNGCTSITDLSKAYPRGEKKMRKAFSVFNTKHTMEWFEKRGVELTIQDDNCVFPVSQNSQTIIDCFLNETRRLGVEIKTESPVLALEKLENEQIQLKFRGDNVVAYDKVIVATGGSPKRQGLTWLEDLGHQIEDPAPSLFTFNMPQEKITELMGIVVEETITRIQGTKLKSNGPLLITHWGMSGPSILKLSAFGARVLSNLSYRFKVQVNWVNIHNINIVEEDLLNLVRLHSQKQIASIRPYFLPDRLWRFLIEKLELDPAKKWDELGKKGVNKIVNILTNDIYDVAGKTTFKEEFVTCGGISLESIDFKTMESKVCKNLYFTGELMDVDGITGGYNFQAAWTTAFIAGKLEHSI
ncbi:MAG: NAD(P)/FAD-dependent oxidoreductase [Crocinitomix sp.]|nr:NAD(P)/FAD-dependent oxidoreductase [Crocinitomix sp.]